MLARRILVSAAMVGGLALVAACGGPSSSSSGDKGSLTISGQNFPEATLMADMYQQLLEHDGYHVTVKLVGTRDVYMAKGQFPGTVQIVPEYLGGIADYLNTQAKGSNAKPVSSPDVQTTLKAAQGLAKPKGIVLLKPSNATDANAFFTTKKYAAAHHLTNLSSLHGTAVTLAAAPDCKGRTDCAGGLENVYGIKIKKVLPLGYASDQTYQSVIKGESQLGETSTTDGSLSSQGLQLLPDDKHVQPAQNLIPAVSAKFLAAHPDVRNTLDGLMAVLTTNDLVRMNGEIGNQRKKPADVAKAYLDQKGLLG
ncbi:ABC transporter substrate-binding protein [Nocardioides terrisoli]|uniref:ABC transporter substrate-binding protein n=1 Tax=Nocardioides terrisoli TaxID=3388267 RepID=UPI00287BA183|nr:ABC transporter substrate-binding protein [Nocardioides marmorisolisilvae]